MKILLNQFIQFYKFFTQLEQTDKEEISNEMNVFIEHLTEIDFDSIDNQYLVAEMLIGDIEGKYTNFGRLYYQFMQFMDSINESHKPTNMGLIQSNNPTIFSQTLSSFLNLLANLKGIDEKLINDTIKNQIELNSNNINYLNSIKDKLENIIPTISFIIEQNIIEQNKKKTFNHDEKFITQVELAKVFNLSPAAIQIQRNNNAYPNSYQEHGDKSKTQIPYSDIEAFVNSKKGHKYFDFWNKYKK